jgi:hypothetical protein
MTLQKIRQNSTRALNILTTAHCLMALVACSSAPPAAATQPNMVATNPPSVPAGAAGQKALVAGQAAPGLAGRTAAVSGMAGTIGPAAVSGGAGSIASAAGGAGAAAGASAVAGGGATAGMGAAGMSGSGGMGATAGTGGTDSGGCLAGITNYEEAGPFKFDMKTSGAVKIWVPMVPAGCKVPVVHMANGTTANCGNYQNAIERLASHGFLTVCYENTDTGAGEMGITALDTALKMFPDLADNKLGSTGHSQGGQASLVTLQLAEAKWGDKFTYTGLAMEPASGYGDQPKGQTWQQSYAKIKSPVFMFSGDSSTGFSNSGLLGQTVGDGLVAISWVDEGYSALSKSVEAYHWTALGATHIPTPEEPEEQISIPWFRWKLLGDKAACEFFKKMPMGGKWKSQKEQNAKACE